MPSHSKISSAIIPHKKIQEYTQHRAERIGCWVGHILLQKAHIFRKLLLICNILLRLIDISLHFTILIFVRNPHWKVEISLIMI